MAGVAPPNGTMRAVFSGPVSTQDTWSISLWFTFGELAGLPSQSELNSIATTFLNRFTTNLWSSGHLLPAIAPATSLTTCTLYWYDGTSASAAVQALATQTAIPGTGSQGNPAYTALCVTLETTHAGRSGRGRIYLPLTGMSLSTTTLQYGGVANVTSAVKATLDALIATYTIDGAGLTALAGVYSRKNNAIYLLNQAACDSIPDTQHGRTNKAIATAKSVVAIP